ncbi:hypothetical protein WJ63_03465 [Burkholderia pyrrocinia]|nr:hypothetical protein WJ63_03465 [Burkholderia pyrrocinia]
MFDRLVAKGALTTTGGRVVSGTSTQYDERGQTLARDGDRATCGNCKGVFSIHGSALAWLDDGKPMVKDGDWVICPCRQNRVIAPGSSTFYYSEGGAKAATTTSPASVSDSAQSFDEQVRASGVGASAGYPFHIEMPDGQTISGRLDDTGNLPRIYTESSDSYTVHWGDDALDKQTEA